MPVFSLFQVSPEDTGAQFLIPAGSLGRNRAEASLERAQNLNPMVAVKADPENVESKPEEFFTHFDAVRARKWGEKGGNWGRDGARGIRAQRRCWRSGA